MLALAFQTRRGDGAIRLDMAIKMIDPTAMSDDIAVLMADSLRATATPSAERAWRDTAP